MQKNDCILFIKFTMQINKSTINLNKIKFPALNTMPKIKSIQADTFVKTSNVSFKGGETDLLINKKYEGLNETEKEILRKQLSRFDWEAVNDCLNSAKALKHLYDEKYGENNWEYISIGRSCANIAKALKILGIKTYIIPISGLQAGIENGKELTKKNGFEKYRQYIYDLGLNPKTIENSGKTYIFQDYCDSGKSLRLFEQFIRSSEMGLDKQNVVFEGINDNLLECFPKLKEWGLRTYNPLIFLTQRLASQNTFMSMKHYTSTPKLPYENLEDIDKIKETPMLHQKLFDFGVEDSIKAVL